MAKPIHPEHRMEKEMSRLVHLLYRKTGILFWWWIKDFRYPGEVLAVLCMLNFPLIRVYLCPFHIFLPHPQARPHPHSPSRPPPRPPRRPQLPPTPPAPFRSRPLLLSSFTFDRGSSRGGRYIPGARSGGAGRGMGRGHGGDNITFSVCRFYVSGTCSRGASCG